MTPNLSAEQGTDARVCLEIDKHPFQPSEVEMVLLTSPTPHFSGYQPQTFTFPVGQNSDQCIDLSIPWVDGLTPGLHTYTFALQSLDSYHELGPNN